MNLLLIPILISSLVSPSISIKCYQCVNNDNNCNNGDCQGDWCVAIYVTKNPFANDHEIRVNKSCASEHPKGYDNDSCIESINPSGRRLSCGCQVDYCNDDKAIQKLAVQGEDGGLVAGNATSAFTGESSPELSTTESSATGTGTSTNETLTEHATSGRLKCVCNKDQFCVKNECTGDACTTEISDQTGTLLTGGGGVFVGVRIAKSCAATMPTGLENNAVTKDTTFALSDGRVAKTKVSILYCNDKDFCNGGARNRPALLLFIIITMSALGYFLA